MAEPPRDDEIPEAVAVPARRRGLPLVWIIPLVAALIGGWLVVQAWLERGPVITITFKTAEGIEAGKTPVKFKNVDIGKVTTIGLSEDGSSIVVAAELTKNAERFLVEDTRFWVVRPRITGAQVSGLSTLLSGAYIGMDAGQSPVPRDEFVGLEVPPIVTADLPGREFVLRGEDLGSLDIGSPVYFRRIQVGEVEAYQLDEDGNAVTLRIFVHAPYDRYVSRGTRFWHASGLDFSVDAGGVKLETESIVTVLLGGIAFHTPAEAMKTGAPEKDAVFTLFPNEEQAFKQPDTEVASFIVPFSESVRGLAVGAPVDFRGVVIGEVTGIELEFDRQKGEVRVPVRVNLYANRLRTRLTRPSATTAPDNGELLDRMVARGLRAQLRAASLLTGQMYVALDFFPDAAPAKVDWNAEPPRLPATPGSLDELQVTLGRIARRLDKVPVEEMVAEMRQATTGLDQTLKGADALLRRVDGEVAPQLTAVLDEARQTLGNARRTLGDDAPLQQDLRRSLEELSRAARSVRNLTDYLERHPESLLRGRREETP